MFPSNLLSFVIASLCIVSPSFAITISLPSQLTTQTYDYVIAGGGTAGLTLASRLTEDPRVTVLVLEAGVSDEGIIAAEAPFLGPTLTPNTPFDWNYTVTPQEGMNGRTFSYPRGKILGGCSTANYLIHQYGTDEDWKRLATVSGDDEWSWANMKKYVQKHERFVPPVDGHNTTNQFIPSLHGFNGMVSVSLPGFNQSIDPMVLEVTKQLSSEWPYNQDTSGGDHSLLGLGFLQSSAGGGKRSSSSTSYLAAANSRPNLTVLLNAVVSKVVQTGTTQDGRKSFRSVQFLTSPGTSLTPAGGPPITVTAHKEVIVSAGAIGTPLILQLSGIGNKEELAKLNITSVIDNPDVGENLSDHTLLPHIFRTQDSPTSFDNILRNSSQVNNIVDQWIQNKTGMFANNVVNNYGFARIPENSEIFKSTRDPAPGPKSPHWELLTSGSYFNPGIPTPDTGSYMTVVAVLLNPTSRGTVKIKSVNPFDKPLIDPKYITTDFDVFTMREAVKSIKRFIAAPAWKNHVIGPLYDSLKSATSDSAIDAYVRAGMTTIFHPVGTAAMANTKAKSGVVNPDLTLKGADGIRIIDASVFPYAPSSHTQGPVYLLAERAADIIKASQK